MRYLVANLIQSTEDVIAHGCNAQGVMGAGVAKAIRESFPEAYQIYRSTFFEKGLTVGEVIWSKESKPIIANCITQEFYGPGDKRYVSYNAVKNCMHQINQYPGIKTVALPKIGAGLAGGDWEIISQIIEQELTLVTPIIYVLNESEIPKCPS